ncbi:unnamed protein product [Merluccius merluccius]
MSWNADGSGVALWPIPSPKRMPASQANQCITLAAYDPTRLPGDGDERAVLLERLCILGGVKGCTPRGQMCGGDLGFAMYLCQVLQGQCRCPPCGGGSGPA